MIQQALNQMLATSVLGMGVYQSTPQAKAEKIKKSAEFDFRKAELQDFDEEGLKDYEKYRDKIIQAAEVHPSRKNVAAAEEVIEERYDERQADARIAAKKAKEKSMEDARKAAEEAATLKRQQEAQEKLRIDNELMKIRREILSAKEAK